SLATMASAIPVLPLVGSRMVSPGDRRPAASAARIIHTAGRSLTEPVGLRSSSLAHNRTSADGESRGNPTRGVFPHASSRLSYLAMLAALVGAARDGGQDRHRVTVVHLGVECTEETYVLVVDVDVDEPVQRAVLGDEAGAQPRELGVEVAEQVGDGVSGAGNDLLAVGVGTQ